MKVFGLAVFLLAVGIGVGRTQHTGTGQGTSTMNPATTPAQDPMGQMQQDATGNKASKPDEALRSVAERQARLREEERQRRLVTDTDKLLALATQLHDDVAKTDKNLLSLDVVKRADEIEKLAHSVKEKMKE